ncbi:hypothetical protein F2P56_003714 [Juglans regia]|uniref:Glutathione S-transferase n=2 Tax=Juglans regia TaxID=51240 RepID=A0A2I4F4K9_JUGRE|nr:glutathione S-transferase U9-like [Juglans regia]KAF5477035.1 hypothetical protein F2P56_003714 [Juglans regia]
MAEEDQVTLHGAWTSPFVKSVELGLKIKGIPYKYVEEDLKNKSPLLLNYNPIHKKVPVLVHNGKPIVESSIILEYIDETWKNGPPLLPQDPYKRAQVRFWVSFLQQQVFETTILVIKSDGEAQEKAIKELFEKLMVLEDGMKNTFTDDDDLEGTTSIKHENIGLLNVVLVSCFGSYKVQEEVLGFKIIDPEKTPLIFSWLEALIEIPAVKEAAPPPEKIVGFLKRFRQNALKSTAI